MSVRACVRARAHCMRGGGGERKERGILHPTGNCDEKGHLMTALQPPPTTKSILDMFIEVEKSSTLASFQKTWPGVTGAWSVDSRGRRIKAIGRTRWGCFCYSNIHLQMNRVA